ncbi:hypothetical protein GUJ93_ZPchr0001g29461 [Zizania palustris]|uniref:Uncharacterized protein n=1 Tax=Zizania palustris TaxID=103762 RepID=A0A8J5VSU3_ZIZPA|nr:hypothetical protein GUJ93_ZPchr0001g29461 [Zizania palustris]
MNCVPARACCDPWSMTTPATAANANPHDAPNDLDIPGPRLVGSAPFSSEARLPTLSESQFGRHLSTCTDSRRQSLRYDIEAPSCLHSLDEAEVQDDQHVPIGPAAWRCAAAAGRETDEAPPPGSGVRRRRIRWRRRSSRRKRRWSWRRGACGGGCGARDGEGEEARRPIGRWKGIEFERIGWFASARGPSTCAFSLSARPNQLLRDIDALIGGGRRRRRRRRRRRLFRATSSMNAACNPSPRRRPLLWLVGASADASSRYGGHPWVEEDVEFAGRGLRHPAAALLERASGCVGSLLPWMRRFQLTYFAFYIMVSAA